MDAKTDASSVLAASQDPYAGRPGRQWWLVVALTLAVVMATIDRTVLSLLFEPIKTDLGLSDTQMALVFGMAFAIANVVFTIPAGYFADRISRRGMIAAGSVVWSVMTSACGVAGGFVQLLGARSGVGFAEAVIHPCSFSMLRGGLSPERRGRGFAIYAMSLMVGAGLGFLLGAVLLQAMTGSGVTRLPLIGEVKPWRLVMLALGVMGLPFTLLMLTVREPARAAAVPGAAAATWKDAFVHIRRRWTVYAPLLAYSAFHGMQSNAYSAFLASIPARKWGIPTADVGRLIGPMMIVISPIGLFVAGWLMDALSKRFGPQGTAMVGVGMTLLTFLFATATPMMPTPAAYFISIGCLFLVGGATLAVTGNILAAITPERSMGKISSVQLFLYGIVGLGFGPTVVGWTSDHLFHGKGAIAQAMGLCNGVFTFTALAMMCIVLATVGRKRVDQP